MTKKHLWMLTIKIRLLVSLGVREGGTWSGMVAKFCLLSWQLVSRVFHLYIDSIRFYVSF